MVKKALHRKKISPAYHTTLPAFMKSDGPYSMYDHSMRYDGANTKPNEPSVTDKATIAALRRYENDLINLKQLREKEKKDFYATLALTNAKASEHAINVRENQRQHAHYVV